MRHLLIANKYLGTQQATPKPKPNRMQCLIQK